MTTSTSSSGVQVPAGRGAHGGTVADYLAQDGLPGVSLDGEYVVLPRAVLERLSRPAQQNCVSALAAAHAAMPAGWAPLYEVRPVYWRPVNELSPEEMTQAGVIADVGAQGDLEYLSRGDGERLPENHLVLAAVDDPLAGGQAVMSRK